MLTSVVLFGILLYRKEIRMSNDITIKISIEAHQELILRKLDTDVPVIKQIDRWLGVNQKGRKNERSKSIQHSK